MSRPISYRPEIGDDVDAGFAWYERQREGLGNEFLAEVRDQIDRIRENPKLYGVLYRAVRASPVRRFEYVVYYRVESDRINIIAVQHARRSPRRWRSRA
jgi:plasmid stabilization system protein ParE